MTASTATSVVWIPALQYKAMERATRSLIDRGGEAGPVIDVTSEATLPKRVPLPCAAASCIVWILIITDQDVDVIRTDRCVGCQVLMPTSSGAAVRHPAVPIWRFKEILVEEVARVYGYNYISDERYRRVW
ncbi:hypothetical protein ACNKHS_08945 [Shigella flexneri]